MLHIQEETMEVCLRQIEEAQFCDQKISRMILPPIVMNDKGVAQIEKLIRATNWKIENIRFWRESQVVKIVIIPISCQSILKNCRNWVVLKIDKDAGQVEIYDTRREIGSLAIIQKHLDQINQMMVEIMGKEYQVEKIQCKPETNQVRDPEDCGLISILIMNHLALELRGEPIFQIFSQDWIKMQRYYLLFNLEVGHMKMEIGKSGVNTQERDLEQITNKRNETLWQEENRSQQTYFNTQVDTWDELVLNSVGQSHMELYKGNDEGKFNEIGENPTVVEDYIFPNKMDNDGSIGSGIIKPRLVQNTTPNQATNISAVEQTNKKWETRNKTQMRKRKDNRINNIQVEFNEKLNQQIFKLIKKPDSEVQIIINFLKYLNLIILMVEFQWSLLTSQRGSNGVD
ncbi:hypothetical protein OXYTRIMIC_418 [Oxytricha trifallax]|uniref:Ubiquitin-like protease family profile domain-containing protein n=1 Tax=Oxytricha trifallax TaxID=1172189 RepID=A0A073HZ65_9SPIT|nr:hypothetical protein OXYTRIMIC_418 [Oxytricha trifallax]